MSVFTNSGTEHCGVRLPGRMRAIQVDGPQLCRPQPGGHARRKSEARTDECGVPLPYTCVSGTQVDYPTCYTDPAAPVQYQDCVLDGFKRITLNANCGAPVVEILNLARVVVPNAIEVLCERSSLPGQPVP